MKLREAVDLVASTGGRFIPAKVREMQVPMAGDVLTVDGDNFELDTAGLDHLSKFLGGPDAKYLERVSPELRRAILDYHLEENIDGEAMIESDGRFVVGLWPANRQLLPRDKVAGVALKVLGASADVPEHGLVLDGGAIRLDVITRKQQAEPREGDVTRGGLRFFAHVSPARGQHQQPRVSSYLHRLICSNGMVRHEEIGGVNLRGTTVEEIIEEMEVAARQLLSDTIPERLEQFSNLDAHRVQHPDLMVRRIGQENRIADTVIGRMQDVVALNDDPTMFDIINTMTEFQHADNVRPTQRERIVEMGGNVIVDHGERRCNKCLHRMD